MAVSCDQTLAQRLKELPPHKALGQHFLLNPEVNRAIVSKAGDLSKINVIEVGPGPGGLTEAILKSCPKSLTVIEKDQRFVDFLLPLKSRDDSLEIVSADALCFDYYKINSPKIIISNLPYNISTQLIFKWLENIKDYRAFYLTLQQEVVDRICADVRTKPYGKLSVLVQYQAKVKKVMNLSPGSFSPPPKVNSAVAEIIPTPSSDVNFFDMERLCRQAFLHRRKMVYKALQELFKDPLSVMDKVGIPHNARAEDISVPKFIDLASQLADLANQA